MLAYTIRRLLQLIPVLFVLTVVVFTFVQLLPGDIIDVMIGEEDVDSEILRFHNALSASRDEILALRKAVERGRRVGPEDLAIFDTQLAYLDDPVFCGDIEKAIMTSDLGLNPMNDGTVIRVPIPPLNEERRKEFVKILHKMAEEGRISIRHARRTVREEIHDLVKEHEIGEDEGRRREDQLEKLTHEYTDKIEGLLKAREEEVMAI